MDIAENNVKKNADRLKLKFRILILQSVLSWFAIIPMGTIIVFLMRYVMGYRIENIREVRRTFKELTKTKQPILICPNHLTMIDSIILIWACGSLCWYIFHFEKYSWNVPAVENFKNTKLRSLVTFLGKSIPVDRNGSKEHLDLVVQKTIYLMKKGEVFTYFAEGGRSRTAKIDIDNIRYGVGKLAVEFPDIKVICVYMRGDSQKGYSEIPAKGEKFEITFQELFPKTQYTGLRAHRDISTQIIQTMKNMENEYFERHQSG
ncbi:MAG: 1-acyl-sn-glycerol-3-phosphate acyltransferase [Spirochaetia bacterium]|nr:1-acyl-sn-glycerol-3-phosphate acyltransferase [Spirochaetia bacterium]